jgi:DNA-binding transcriptional regulator YiaG
MSRTQLYRHFDSRGELLYIGVSLRALQRLSQHRGSATWFPSIARVTLQEYDTRKEALIAEREAIKTELPKFNSTHIPLLQKQTAPMTPTQYAAAIERLGLTQRAAGAFLGVDERQSRRWIAGDARIPEAVAKLLRLMIRLKLTPDDCP